MLDDALQRGKRERGEKKGEGGEEKVKNIM